MRAHRRWFMAILFILPALMVYLPFFVYPSLSALRVSLFDWSGFVPQMKFVGLANFRELAKDPIFWISLKNSLFFMVAGGAIVLSIALLFAKILSRELLPGKRLLRAIVFFPLVVPTAGLGIIGTYFFNPAGILNTVLDRLGLDALNRTWLGPEMAVYSALAAVVWATMGFSMVIILAGMERIPCTFAEAAQVEGANEAQILFRVTLPMMRDVLATVIVFWMIGALKLFELIYALTGGGPNYATSTISIFSYVMAFGQRETIYRMGYATAAGVVLFLLVIVSAGLGQLLRGERIEY